MDGVTKHGVARAERYWEGLFQQFEALAYNPNLYHERTEITPPVRVCPYGVHVIIYCVEKDDPPLIIRVRHAREDWL